MRASSWPKPGQIRVNTARFGRELASLGRTWSIPGQTRPNPGQFRSDALECVRPSIDLVQLWLTPGQHLLASSKNISFAGPRSAKAPNSCSMFGRNRQLRLAPAISGQLQFKFGSSGSFRGQLSSGSLGEGWQMGSKSGRDGRPESGHSRPLIVVAGLPATRPFPEATCLCPCCDACLRASWSFAAFLLSGFPQERFWHPDGKSRFPKTQRRLGQERVGVPSHRRPPVACFGRVRNLRVVSAFLSVGTRSTKTWQESRPFSGHARHKHRARIRRRSSALGTPLSYWGGPG